MKVDYYLPAVGLPAVADLSRRVLGLGFDGFFTAETKHDPFLPLGVVASATPALELGTGIAVAFARSPMVVAQAAWDLAAASRGKFMLGLGTQVQTHIVHRFSMPWAAPEPRLREYIGALRAIWTAWQQGTPLRFKGDHYRFLLMTPFFDPGPIEHPLVPVYIAAVGSRLAALAGEECQGLLVHPLHTTRYLDEVTRPAVQAGIERAGRDEKAVALAAAVFVATGSTAAEIMKAREAVRRQIGFYASTPTYRPVLDLHGWNIGPDLSALAQRRDWDAMAGLISDDMLDEIAVTGPPDELGGLLRQRYGDRLARIAFYGAGPGQTPGLTDDDWAGIITELRS